MNNLNSLNYGNKLLKKKNIITYRLDSELLLSKALNKNREDLLIDLNTNIKKEEFDSFKKLLKRRAFKEPIAYILKRKEFWKNSFLVSRDVLIPRPETEIIVEELLKLTDINSSKSFLDVGSGSGCLIISIIKERPNFYGTALDVSKKAIKIANINAKMHHLQNKIKFKIIDIDKFNHYKYDFIISNPPYINDFDLKRLDDDITNYEPKIALEAGEDGLNVIRKIIFKSKTLLKKNGKLIFEIGYNQKIKVINLLKENKFFINKICNDFNSLPRVIISTKTF